MPQSPRATIGRKTIDLFSTLRHWNFRNLTLQQECYLTSTRDFFRNTHGSIMLPPRQPRVFARLGSLAITTEGQRHLGAVIGSRQLKDQYCRAKVLGWKGELEALSEIARSQPHAAYTVFTKGYKSKFTYFMRTIESFEDYVDPI